MQSTEAEAATYDPRDQYMPYFLAGDPTMSDEKAAAASRLLHHWLDTLRQNPEGNSVGGINNFI